MFVKKLIKKDKNEKIKRNADVSLKNTLSGKGRVTAADEEQYAGRWWTEDRRYGLREKGDILNQMLEAFRTKSMRQWCTSGGPAAMTRCYRSWPVIWTLRIE